MSTSLSATIMEFLNNIFGDPAERAEFLDNPEAYFSAHNLDDLSCADFDDALVSFFDNAKFDNDRGDNNAGGTFTNTVAGPGQSDHEAIAQHLTSIVHEYGDTYITNNDNDVINDASFNGTIIAGDDVTFDNDIVSASGDGAVAAGDDINGDVVTGDDNVIGDDNQVGDGAFGDGSNTGGISASGGSAVSLAGDDATSSGNQDNSSDDDVTLSDVGNDKSSDDDTTTTTTTTTEINTDIDTDIDQSTRNEDAFNQSSSNDGDDGNVASGNQLAGDDINT